MVTSAEESLIYNIKLSSVGPGSMTGQDITHEPTNIDLAMKLHYLRGVYYFKSQAFEGTTIMHIKEAMFKWLNQFYVACGRLRRSDSGRPYIKCNDCGVRVVEAQCTKTLDEWMDMVKENCSLQKLLVSNQVIGPELPFSPLVLLQLTKFKCEGISMGLSWAHILGDAFFASEFMNMWGRTMSGHNPAPPPNLAQHIKTNLDMFSPSPKKPNDDPLSLQRVDPVGDNWIAPNNMRMESYSFHVSATKLGHLQSKISGLKNSNRVPPFESLCTIIWHCIAKVKNQSESKVVTICKYDPFKKKKGIFNDNQVISIVKADFSVAKANPKDLATVVMDQEAATNELKKIEEEVEKNNGVSDFIVYGVNLTFVDLEEANFYGLELKGQNPVHVSYAIDGIGQGGIVMVLPTPKYGGGGRFVTVTLPENQLLEVKNELKREWLIA